MSTDLACLGQGHRPPAEGRVAAGGKALGGSSNPGYDSRRYYIGWRRCRSAGRFGPPRCVSSIQRNESSQGYSDTHCQNCDPPSRGKRETYYHYSTDGPLSFAGGLLPASSATTVSGLDSYSASRGLGIRPPLYEYPVTVDPNVRQCRMWAQYNATSTVRGTTGHIFQKWNPPRISRSSKTSSTDTSMRRIIRF